MTVSGVAVLACASEAPEPLDAPTPKIASVRQAAETTGNAWASMTCVHKSDGRPCITYTIGQSADRSPYGAPCSEGGMGGPGVEGPPVCSQSELSTTYQCLHNWCAYGCVPGNSPPGYHDDDWIPVFTCTSSPACGPSCGEAGCNNPDPACKCGSGQTCNALGICEACVPKTCDDYPGRCSTTGDGGAGEPLTDGCGKPLDCACETGKECSTAGVCVDPDCNATNRPEGPGGAQQGFPPPPGINLEYEMPKAVAAFLCRLPQALGLPTLSSKAKIKGDLAINYDEYGETVCVSKTKSLVKGGAEAELCGWLFGLKGSYSSLTETDYCPECQKGEPDVNVCTSEVGRSSYSNKLRMSGELGQKFEMGTGDLVNWLVEKFKYKKTGTGENVHVVKQLPYYDKVMSFVGANQDAINDIAKVKAEAKLSKNFERSVDQVQRGNGRCASGVQCEKTYLGIGPGIGAGASVEINLPPKKANWLGVAGDVVSFNVEAKLAANGWYQYGLSMQSGACGDKNCVSAKGYGNFGTSLRMGARIKGVSKVRATLDFVCQGSVGVEACDDLTAGLIPPEGECKANSFISTE